ncbi:MAG: hypothetical protein ACE5LU_27195 [Anaerolineae bacterium]
MSIFSGISGAILIVAAKPLASLIGVDAPAILTLIGVGLLFYAALLFWIAAREPINRRLVLIAAILDTAWVIDSAILLVAGWFSLTTAGKWAIALVAEVVAIFAALQFYSVWQMRERHITTGNLSKGNRAMNESISPADG